MTALWPAPGDLNMTKWFVWHNALILDKLGWEMISQANFSIINLCYDMGNVVSNKCNKFLSNLEKMPSSKIRILCSSTISDNNQWVACVLLRNTLQWRHSESDCVSNHRRLDCLLNRLFRRRSHNTSKLRVTEGNSPVIGEFPAQRASNSDKGFQLMTSSWTTWRTISGYTIEVWCIWAVIENSRLQACSILTIINTFMDIIIWFVSI